MSDQNTPRSPDRHPAGPTPPTPTGVVAPPGNNYYYPAPPAPYYPPPIPGYYVPHPYYQFPQHYQGLVQPPPIQAPPYHVPIQPPQQILVQPPQQIPVQPPQQVPVQHYHCGPQVLQNVCGGTPVQPENDSPIPPPLPEPKHYLLTCAIDFGTTYTGYAISFVEKYKINKLEIHGKTWKSEHGESEKTPTVALFNPEMQFKYFGYEAEKEYAKLEPHDKKKWYLFQRFKMKLHKNTDLDLHSTIKPYNRNDEVLAIKIFSSIMQYLRENVLKTVRTTEGYKNIDMDKIQWVITVPAIWSDRAKIFMRTAAERAGIDRQNMTLALEPEAAALYCRHIKSEMRPTQENDAEPTPLGPGDKYIVADLGGGTVDITVYRNKEDGSLEEIHTASGGHWGGTTVDDAFRNMLIAIYGGDVLYTAKERDPGEMLNMQYQFELAKRKYSPSEKKSISFKIPAVLGELLQELTGQDVKEYIGNIGRSGEGLSFLADKIIISSERFRMLFSDSLDNMIQHLDNLMTNCNLGDLNALILVGGYSEAKIIRESFVNYFKNSTNGLKVISPLDPSMAVLKGATLFGHEPLAISSRICKYTYGIALTIPFEEGKHPESKKVNIGGTFFCDDIFAVHLTKGDPVAIGSERLIMECRPPIDHNKAIVEIFASSEKNPKFVTEESCLRLGSSFIDLSSEIKDSDPVFVELIYAGTEMEVQIREGRSGKISRGKVDFVG